MKRSIVKILYKIVAHSSNFTSSFRELAHQFYSTDRVKLHPLNHLAHNLYSGWSIHLDSGHCYHPAGIDVYVDPEPTETGTIRLVGPYFRQGLARKSTASYLSILVLLLEQQVFPKCRYSVWGTDAARSKGYPSINLTGVTIGYRANPLRRSSLLLGTTFIWKLQAEWKRVSTRTLIHESGLILDLPAAEITPTPGADRNLYGPEPKVDQCHDISLLRLIDRVIPQPGKSTYW